MREGSAKESRGSDGSIGFIHRITDAQPNLRPAQPNEPKLTIAELTTMARRMYEHQEAKHVREKESERLGVSVASLDALRVGYGADKGSGRAFSSWPARDDRGRVVGIVRRYDDGSKKSVKGGSVGLFYALDWIKGKGPVFIVEGGSDTAAGITAGLRVIGRPSNLGGGAAVRKMIQGKGLRVVVVGEYDAKPDKRGLCQGCPKECEGCGVCFPGKYGAIRVAAEIGCEWCLPPEGMKDLREAFNEGKLWPELLRAV